MSTEAESVSSATAVAVIVAFTVCSTGSGGASNVTDVLVGSCSVPAPDSGAMVQVTPACDGSCRTVAVSVWFCPKSTVAPFGSMDTTIAGTVMVAKADFALSATDVAVIVTATSLAGGSSGA